MVADGGQQNADGKLPLILCRWQNPYERKTNFRCFLKVLFVNKPSHLIEFRLGEVQCFIFKHKTEKPDKPCSNTNRPDLYRPTPLFLHDIEEGLSLSTIKQISNA